ncbi:MAG: type II toxin-antitoxin system HicB family antitoxin [Nitrososphaerota archaeon]|nr:type II toxin-antitoxin system HicB family antitoxin [Nitrososphaerota archaeon]MDG6917551.1 type II toxin-antitoxin system HicB family antitoxin [Nitrososphaerota archaeon]MDG6919510.1 type II toxin-antitoxin system HicB family antitoxin [Nitrososphaerota archaeon]MDG6946738.1 type II toxin-antitoxin system HicB family antitoxin [Nitrososphaerota archaeon]
MPSFRKAYLQLQDPHRCSLKAQTEATFNVVVEKDEDGFYVASVVELPGCHTQARKLDQLDARAREAIEGYLMVAHPKHGPEFVGTHQLRIKLPQ